MVVTMKDLYPMKYKKYKASRFIYKYERDAISHINGTKRGKGKNLAQMNTRHSNYEWIWVEPIDGNSTS